MREQRDFNVKSTFFSVDEFYEDAAVETIYHYIELHRLLLVKRYTSSYPTPNKICIQFRNNLLNITPFAQSEVSEYAPV